MEQNPNPLVFGGANPESEALNTLVTLCCIFVIKRVDGRKSYAEIR